MSAKPNERNILSNGSLKIRTTGSEGVVLQSCRKNLHSLEAVRAANYSQRRVCSLTLSLSMYISLKKLAFIASISLKPATGGVKA